MRILLHGEHPRTSSLDSKDVDPPVAGFYAALRRDHRAVPLACFVTALYTDITWPWPEARIETLQNILEKARANNHTKGITGALVYVEGVFLQILEGNESDVKILAERISRDDRHAGFKVLLEKEVTERLFGAWDMACIRPSAKEMAGWASMDGTTTVTDIVNKLQKESGRVADLVTNIVKSHAGSGPAFRGEV